MSNTITVSLEQAKALKKAGWPQRAHLKCNDGIMRWIGNTPFYWSDNGTKEWELLESSRGLVESDIAAPTAEEILRRLPVEIYKDGKEYRIEMLKRHGENNNEFYVNYRFYTECIEFLFDSLADACAACYCYLANNKLLP